MFSHIFTSVSEFQRAFGFYSALMDSLGHELRFCEPDKPWAGWQSPGQARPLFVICKPFDGQPHEAGNGQMVAFIAHERQIVRSAYQVALAMAAPARALPGRALATTPTMTARTSVIRMATKSAWPATTQPRLEGAPQQ